MPIDQPQFEFVRDLVREVSAIVLGPGKEYLVDSRMTPLARELGYAGVGDLLDELRATRKPALVELVVDAMTTNETSFLRDLHPFVALRESILPALIEARGGVRKLSIWSAASSTGQEAYTIAMTIASEFPELESWDVRILATDLSDRVLKKAREGYYSQIEVNRGLPPDLLSRYFRKEGVGWRLDSAIRQRVEFRKLNLIERWPLLPRMDVVFLRNVLIYFDSDTKSQILANVYERMADDGYLFLGAAETTFEIADQFGRVDLGAMACFRPRA